VGKTSAFSRLAPVVPLILLLLRPAAARAGDACPWMNAATAGGVLGGKVSSASVTLSGNEKDEGRCVYELQRGEAVSRLTIEVNAMRMPAHDFPTFSARCGSEAAHLKAIGNEAVACSGATSSERWEMLVGRVRQYAFVVRLSTNEQSDQSPGYREKARKAAEYVASGLF